MPPKSPASTRGGLTKGSPTSATRGRGAVRGARGGVTRSASTTPPRSTTPTGRGTPPRTSTPPPRTSPASARTTTPPRTTSPRPGTSSKLTPSPKSSPASKTVTPLRNGTNSRSITPPRAGRKSSFDSQKDGDAVSDTSSIRSSTSSNFVRDGGSSIPKPRQGKATNIPSLRTSSSSPKPPTGRGSPASNKAPASKLPLGTNRSASPKSKMPVPGRSDSSIAKPASSVNSSRKPVNDNLNQPSENLASQMNSLSLQNGEGSADVENADRPVLLKQSTFTKDSASLPEQTPETNPLSGDEKVLSPVQSEEAPSVTESESSMPSMKGGWRRTNSRAPVSQDSKKSLSGNKPVNKIPSASKIVSKSSNKSSLNTRTSAPNQKENSSLRRSESPSRLSTTSQRSESPSRRSTSSQSSVSKQRTTQSSKGAPVSQRSNSPASKINTGLQKSGPAGKRSASPAGQRINSSPSTTRSSTPTKFEATPKTNLSGNKPKICGDRQSTPSPRNSTSPKPGTPSKISRNVVGNRQEKSEPAKHNTSKDSDSVQTPSKFGTFTKKKGSSNTSSSKDQKESNEETEAVENTVQNELSSSEQGKTKQRPKDLCKELNIPVRNCGGKITSPTRETADGEGVWMKRADDEASFVKDCSVSTHSFSRHSSSYSLSSVSTILQTGSLSRQKSAQPDVASGRKSPAVLSRKNLFPSLNKNSNSKSSSKSSLDSSKSSGKATPKLQTKNKHEAEEKKDPSSPEKKAEKKRFSFLKLIGGKRSDSDSEGKEKSRGFFSRKEKKSPKNLKVQTKMRTESESSGDQILPSPPLAEFEPELDVIGADLNFDRRLDELDAWNSDDDIDKEVMPDEFVEWDSCSDIMKEEMPDEFIESCSEVDTDPATPLSPGLKAPPSNPHHQDYPNGQRGYQPPNGETVGVSSNRESKDLSPNGYSGDCMSPDSNDGDICEEQYFYCENRLNSFIRLENHNGADETDDTFMEAELNSCPTPQNQRSRSMSDATGDHSPHRPQRLKLPQKPFGVHRSDTSPSSTAVPVLVSPYNYSPNPNRKGDSDVISSGSAMGFQKDDSSRSSSEMVSPTGSSRVTTV